jgi:hypothetical protein
VANIASSQREGAFSETLSRYRIDLHVTAEQQAIERDLEDGDYPGRSPSV